ncbi:permease [Salmonella enterica subsp. enterica]|uniref:Permease n=1 Tax=Salmonella enterica I TaxID=59201 RepID=A0A3S4LV26_SALET|nr:permease [Salmonella enterica subsp. enterica]
MIALAISVLLAVYTLVPRMDKHTTAERLEEGLQSAGIILLVTGAGGALGAILRDSGAGATAGGAGCQPADLADPDPVYRGDAGTPDSGIGDGGDDHCRLDFRADPGADPRHQYVACRSGRNDGVAVLRLLQR